MKMPDEIAKKKKRVKILQSKSHDVFLNYPARDWGEGIPIGNGFLGSIIYGDPSMLSFTLNRSDVWDYRYKEFDPEGKLKFNQLKNLLKKRNEKAYKDFVKETEDHSSKYPYPAPQTCGRMQISFKSDAGRYCQRLSPEIGKTFIEFSYNKKKRVIEVFIPPELPIMFVKIKGKNLEPFSIFLNRDGLSIIPELIKSEIPSEKIKIEYAGNKELFKMIGKFPDGLYFEVGIKEKEGIFSSIDTGTGKVDIHPDGKNEITIVLGVVSGYKREKLDEEIAKVINNSSKNYTLLNTRHLQEWGKFWSQSSITIPDKLLEHIWYISQYFLNSTLKYANQAPGLYGLWTYHDITPWRGDYHLDRNLQAVLEPLFSSNHIELADVYYDFFISVLPEIRKQTKKFYRWDGISFPGSIGPKGENMGGYFPVSHWEGTSSWISLLFWWKYRFTMDNDFLKEKAYPFMKECGIFYEKYLGEKREDGKYHLWPSYLPETGANSMKAWGTDSAIDIGLLRFLFGALIKAAKILGKDKEDIKKWEEILSGLPDYPTWDGAIVDYQEWPELYEKESIFTDDLRIAPIYPIGDINQDSPDELLELGRRTFYSLGKHHARIWLLTESAVASRLGISELSYGYIRTWAQDITPQGIGTYSTGISIGWRDTSLNDGIRKLYKLVPWNYSVFGIEFPSNFISALNEMLLQSCGEKIRVFPAVPSEWKEVKFENFRAERAFLISAYMKDGVVNKIVVKSIKGEELLLVNPEPARKFCIKKNGKKLGIGEGKIFRLKTTPSSCYEFTIK